MDFFFKNAFFQFFLAAFFAQNAAAQCPGQMNFYEQKRVDSFPFDYPGCKIIAGPVGINGATVNNLDGLIGLESIGGNLWIHDTNLKNLHGLDSLKLVGGHFTFDKNPKLESFEGLGNLHRIGFGLGISGNSQPKIKNFQGFEKLERVDGYIQISYGNFESLHGLENLRFVGQNLQVSGTQIQDLTGLEKLDSVGIHLALGSMKRLKSLSGVKNLRYTSPNISGCDSLKNLKGLEALESGYAIYLYENQQLESLDGLENFKEFSFPTYPWGSLHLTDNPKLNDLSALDHPLKINNLFLKNNPELAICNVQSICEHLTAPGDSTFILGNFPGCNSAGEILGNCSLTTGDILEKLAFQISPNPISENQPLQIFLENDFFGTVKIEILSLDGRVLQVLEKEKTAQNQVFEIENLPVQNSFFVRVSDGKTSAARLVVKF